MLEFAMFPCDRVELALGTKRMLSNGRHVRWIAGWLAAMGVALFAGDFVSPTEGPVAFRRDRIPLDADAMAGLSKELEELADGLNPKTAASRRGVAQMLALAMALDPANARARELVSKYRDGRNKSDEDAEKTARCRSGIQRYAAWLQAPEAGSQGQALAACLGDIIAISDPNPSQAGASDGMAERGAWAGWIPGLSSYETKVIAKVDEPAGSRPRVLPGRKNEILLSAAQVHTVLWQNTGKAEAPNWILAAAPLKMSVRKIAADEDGVPYPFSIGIGPGGEGGTFSQLGVSIRTLLSGHHGNLPPGYHISITSAELEQSILSKKRQSLSAAAAVLASSAISGHEPDAIIIGQIDEAGKFKLPTGFWDQLHSLGKGSGQRLALPADSAEYLSALLAMEKPGFFLDYEVLLASNLKELLDLTAKTPDGTLATASTKFREIQSRVGTQDLRQYIANPFVRKRIAEVVQDAPSHFSARMLLLQAAGSRPTLITRKVLAAELRRSIEPMDWVVKMASIPLNEDTKAINYSPYRFSAANIAKFDEIYDLCRTRLDGLDRYVEKNDIELMDRARKVNIAIRSLYRANRTRGESYAVTAGVRSACRDFIQIRSQLSTDLAREAGEVMFAPSR